MNAIDTVQLEIAGMTCASCANRIERKLNKLDGVSASVNYATEKASVQHRPGIAVEDLLRTVEQAGDAAAPHEDDPAGGKAPHDTAAPACAPRTSGAESCSRPLPRCR